MSQETYARGPMDLYVGDSPDRPEWHGMKRCGAEFDMAIPWAELVREASAAYDWVSQQPNAWTRGGHMSGACLVAALFVPRPQGGYIFLSTIGRGARANEILIRRNRATWAPAWLAANDGLPTAIHCEDGVCVDFERFNGSLSYDDMRKVAIGHDYHEEEYVKYMPRDEYNGRFNYRLQIAIFGGKNGIGGPGVGLHLPCREGDRSTYPKTPSCQTVLERLGIEWYTRELLEYEYSIRGGIPFDTPPSGDSGSAGTGNGGGASGSGTGMGGGAGHSSAGHSGTGHRSAGHSGTGHSGTGYSGTVYSGTGYSGTGQEFRPPQGGSKAANFSKSARKSSNPSYNITDHMSKLSINAGNPAASVPNAQSGYDAYGYAGDAYPAHSNASGYHGYDSNTSYRPSTASSGGSGGEYTTRPPSRDSATGAAGHASVPRTAAQAHPLGTHHNAQAPRPPSRDSTTGHAGHGSAPRAATPVHNAPASRPPGRGNAGQIPPPVPKSGPAAGGPSKPPAAASKPAAVQGTPTPPRKVKLESAKINGTFTVHGIGKDKPFIKGVDVRKPGDHHEVSYSKRSNKFYIERKKERIYLTAV